MLHGPLHATGYKVPNLQMADGQKLQVVGYLGGGRSISVYAVTMSGDAQMVGAETLKPRILKHQGG
jgi:hypothetical protein